MKNKEKLISPTSADYNRFREFLASCPPSLGSSFPDVVTVKAADLRPPVAPCLHDLDEMGYFAVTTPVIPAIVHHSHSAACVCPDCLSSHQNGQL
jgi:hypothetical protein